jgi:hypothetical protein
MNRSSKRLVVLSILAASLAAGCGGGGGGSTSTGGGTGNAGGTPTGSTGGGAGGGTGSGDTGTGTGNTGGGTTVGTGGDAGGGTGTGTSTGGTGTGTGTSSATTWRTAKIGGGGYVTGLVFHPATANLLYARTDVGGAYRWNEATKSWVAITDGFGEAEGFYHGVESLALDPNNDQTVYIATGIDAAAGSTGRLYLSSDQGDHWTHVDLPFPVGSNDPGRAIGERLAVDPNQPSTLYYGSRNAGLWKSTDSGHTWAQVTALSSAQPTNLGGNAIGVELVVFDTGTKGSGTATQTIYAAIAPDYVSAAGLSSNLYKSTDAGASWAPVPTPITGYHIPHIARAADGVFYVAFTKGKGPGDAGPGRLYKFDGTTWTPLASNDSAGYGGVSVYGSGATTRIALGVSGTWGNYAGQQIVQLSDDAGLHWHEIEAGMPGVTASGWVDDVEIDPFNRDRILHVHGGGIEETRTASSTTPTWAAAVDGLEETCTIALDTPPAGAPYTLLNGSGDIGTWVHTDLTTAPTESPYKNWSSGNSIDLAWADPLYIAGVGVNNSSTTGMGFWSGDGGKTWAMFAALPPGGATKTSGESNIAVTARNKAVWAPADTVPSYTTDNGATWTATDLPALANANINRAYRLVADRKNPNKVYAYDSGGAWWTYTQAKVYVSTDGGHHFTLSQGSVSAKMRFAPFGSSSMAVNPNVEGDLWVADGLALYHSVDSGATWTPLTQFAPVWAGRNDWDGPALAGASLVALGKAKAGSPYSAAVYVVGVIDGVWGVYRSDDGGATWARFNDDAHQFGGIGVMAADQNVYGRIYTGGNCRGVQYSN